MFGVAKGSQKTIRHLAIDWQVVVPLKISDCALNVDFHRIIHCSVVSKLDTTTNTTGGGGRRKDD